MSEEALMAEAEDVGYDELMAAAIMLIELKIDALSWTAGEDLSILAEATKAIVHEISTLPEPETRVRLYDRVEARVKPLVPEERWNSWLAYFARERVSAKREIRRREAETISPVDRLTRFLDSCDW